MALQMIEWRDDGKVNLGCTLERLSVVRKFGSSAKEVQDVVVDHHEDEE